MRLTCLLVVLFPVAACAEPVIYECAVDTNQSNGAFQNQLVIAHDAEEQIVSVSDAMIVGVTGGPLLGDVATDNSTRIVFKWTVLNVPAGNGQILSLAYRATIFKENGKLDISMRPLNFDNSYSAQGTCRTG